jgi:hypothetical protein
MNHTQILKRAWSILWSYKVLWIFGIILALTIPNRNGDDNPRYEFSVDEARQWNMPAEARQMMERMNDFFSDPGNTTTIIFAIVGIVALVLLLGVVVAIARYVSQVALMRMVDGYEANGVKATWRQGVRLGWSRAAWRVFLVNLVVFLPMLLVVLVLFGCAAIPAILSYSSGDMPTWPGIVAAIGLAFMVIFLVFLVAVALSLVLETVYRVIVLGGTGVMDGLRQGWQLVRRNFKDVFVMWLILIGIQLGFFIVMVPVVLLLGFIGVVLGGGAGISAYLLIQMVANPVMAAIIAVFLGGGLFVGLIGLPLLFINGLKETYLSTVWTLVYRSLVAPVAAEAQPEAVLPSAGVEPPVLPA